MERVMKQMEHDMQSAFGLDKNWYRVGFQEAE